MVLKFESVIEESGPSLPVASHVYVQSVVPPNDSVRIRSSLSKVQVVVPVEPVIWVQRSLAAMTCSAVGVFRVSTLRRKRLAERDASAPARLGERNASVLVRVAAEQS